MNDILFLTIEEVRILHRHQIASYGGEHGVRDAGLLESALAQPKAMFNGDYLHRDIFEMAAAYLFHLVKNHPFIDGNKRVGALTAYVFLMINGYRLTMLPDPFTEMVLAVAEGRLDKTEIARFFREHTEDK